MMTNASASPPVVLDEKVFSERVAKIKVGNTQARVLELLGPPKNPAAKSWTYRNPPNRPDGPYHVHTFTFDKGAVIRIDESSVGCVINE